MKNPSTVSDDLTAFDKSLEALRRGYSSAKIDPREFQLSTPKQKCISDAGKKAPELGVFSLEVKPGWDYPR
jgi:hypothetical protein